MNGPWSPRPRNQSTLTKSFDLSPFVLCQFQDLNNCPTETASVICIVNLILFVVLFLRLPIVRICEIHCCDFGAPANFFAGSSFLMDIDIGWKSLCVESIFIGSTPIIANVSLADKDAHSKLVDHVTDVYVGVECWCWCYIAW